MNNLLDRLENNFNKLISDDTDFALESFFDRKEKESNIKENKKSDSSIKLILSNDERKELITKIEKVLNNGEKSLFITVNKENINKFIKNEISEPIILEFKYKKKLTEDTFENQISIFNNICNNINKSLINSPYIAKVTNEYHNAIITLRNK